MRLFKHFLTGAGRTADALKTLLTTDTTFSADLWHINADTTYAYPELKTLPYERIIIFGNWKEKNRILAEKLYEDAKNVFEFADSEKSF